MKQVYSYQELTPLIEQGQGVTFTCHLEARVTAIRQHQDNEPIAVTIALSIRDTSIGTIEQEYASIFAVLDAFDIDVYADMWEAG